MQSTAFGKAAGLSQADICRKFMSMPKMKDGLKRDERTFNAEVWPIINSYRQRDREMTSIQRLVFGKNVDVWQPK